MNLEHKIDVIKELFDKTLFELNGISIDHFDSHFNRAKKNVTDINKLREELLQDFSLEELEKYDQELLDLAKQIKNTYDNIIGKFTEERNILSEKLKSVQNKKKIANYSR